MQSILINYKNLSVTSYYLYYKLWAVEMVFSLLKISASLGISVISITVIVVRNFLKLTFYAEQFVKCL